MPRGLRGGVGAGLMSFLLAVLPFVVPGALRAQSVALEAGRFSWSVGGGLGFLDRSYRWRLDGDERGTVALTTSTVWRYRLNPSTGVYARGDVSLLRTPRPYGGFVRLGLEWTPW